MPRLQSVATAVPPHVLPQARARELAGRHFASGLSGLGRLLPLFLRAGVDQRYLARPPEWYLANPSFEESTRVFVEVATDLASDAVGRVLQEAGLDLDQVDYLLLVNSTGLATPSIDARVINRLGLPRHIRRTPIWGLGCAGGVAGLAHAYHHALGHPRSRTLVVALELCSLTFLSDDFGKSNLVASALFGDGAAAALVTGDAVDGPGYDILDTRSTFYPDSLDVMGWNVRARGLQVVFNRRIPEIVSANARGELEEFLALHGLVPGDLSLCLLHPGGHKVLDAYRRAYDLPEEAFLFSVETLREYGNMSSATVLFVLERCLRDGALSPGQLAVAGALGPGFCSETALLRAR